ncbi:GPW/gp25 family protein [Pseudanabaenaceae cyanobacterium LEGE 13415]|nr:GPW/gp25 family protein [Pseudanabaenaceae cyanobacterium LEGE 13415]
MNSDFWGQGWASPFSLKTEQVELVQGEAAIRQSILMILGTAKGERLMRPDFGCGIHDLVFSNNDATTIGEIFREVQQALLEWEPRIDVLDIRVTPDVASPNRLLIELNYQVRTTNNRFNLVYPFYLAAQ